MSPVIKRFPTAPAPFMLTEGAKNLVASIYSFNRSLAAWAILGFSYFKTLVFLVLFTRHILMPQSFAFGT